MYKIYTKSELHFCLSEIPFVTFEHIFECYVDSLDEALNLAHSLAEKELDERCKSYLDSGLVEAYISTREVK